MNSYEQKVVEEVKSACPSAVGVFVKAYTTDSKAAAIKAFCLRCVGYLRKDVAECTSYGCPLYRHRPFQSGAEEKQISAEPVACGSDQ